MRLLKYIRVRLGIFFSIEIVLTLLMSYYIIIFCTVYHESQGSIIGNYFIGIGISVATSVGLTIIISFMRIISFTFQNARLYNLSKYLYDHF